MAQFSDLPNRLPKWWFYGALILLAPLALASVWQGFSRVEYQHCDFEQVWAAGVILQNGGDSIRASVDAGPELANLEHTDQIRCQPLVLRPFGHSPLLHILLAISVSALEYYSGKYIWFAAMLTIIVALPPLFMGLNRGRITWRMLLMLELLALGWAATRNTLGFGQATPIILLCSALALWFTSRNHKLLAGICLGLALSKFTFAGALVLYFLMYRHYRILLVAALVQVGGFLIYAAFVGQSPLTTAENYFLMLNTLTGQDNAVSSLDGYLNFIGIQPTISVLISASLMALVTIALVIPRYVGEALGKPELTDPALALAKEHLLIIISILVGMLGVYHRTYDLLLLIVIPALIPSISYERAINPRVRKWYFFAAAFLSVAMLTIRGPLEDMMPEAIALQIGVLPFTVSMIVMLVVAIWSVYHLKKEGDEPAEIELAAAPKAH